MIALLVAVALILIILAMIFGRLDLLYGIVLIVIVVVVAVLLGGLQIHK